MRTKRNQERKRALLLGYHTGDVTRTLETLERQIAFMDSAAKEERVSFERLFFEKSKHVEQLQQLLDEELAKEEELKRRRDPL